MSASILPLAPPTPTPTSLLHQSPPPNTQPPPPPPAPPAPPPPALGTHLPLPALTRAASQITPNLYLADAHTATAPHVLAALGITHVVSVLGPALRFPAGIRVLHLPLDDYPWEDLLSHLHRTNEWLRDALKGERNKVMVHCWQGISRSASIVAAYFIKTQNMSADQAVRYVKSKRSIVSPNQGFMRQLRQYEAIVKADDESDYSMK